MARFEHCSFVFRQKIWTYSGSPPPPPSVFRNTNIIEKLSWYARLRPKSINTPYYNLCYRERYM